MPDVLNALVAFVAEHQRCGDLDGGRDNGNVWLACRLRGLEIDDEVEPSSCATGRSPGFGAWTQKREW
jgi:hypothetical protein